MKHNILSMAAIAVSAMSISCSRENTAQQEEKYQNSPFEVTISGEMGEFAPTTKSTAESCIRMKWQANDVVWAYDCNGNSLGKLTVHLENSNAYVAVMTGTLNSAPSDGKLFLIHSRLMETEKQWQMTDKAMTIDIDTQAADVIPFVAYAVVEGVTQKDKYATTGLKTKFSFATSVLKVNATGIAKDAKLKSADISNIETGCTLTIKNGAFVITGHTYSSGTGSITKYLSGTASLSRASFYVAVPSFSAGAQRVLTVKAGDKTYYEHKVMQTAYEANNYINYVYEVKTLDYTDEYGESRGDGTYIANTGVVWAPVNCGYEPTDRPTGLFYQWGRKYGQSTTKEMTSDDFITTQAASMAAGNIPANSEKFYKAGNCWYSNYTTSDTWKSEYDPCPADWRVPTYDELNALTGNGTASAAGFVTKDGKSGHYFNGTTTLDTKTGDTYNGVFLPAAGYRYSSDGSVSSYNTAGYYWSSSPYSTDANNARHLTLDEKNAGVGSYNYVRASGFSVRCVQE